MSYSRWLPMRLNRPVDAMRSIYVALKPGGRAVVGAGSRHECDLTRSRRPATTSTSELVAFAVGATLGVRTMRVVAACTGGRAEAGFDVPHIDAYHPHYLTGEHKGFWTRGPTARPEQTSSRRARMTESRYGEMCAAMRAADGTIPLTLVRSRPHASARCAQAAVCALREAGLQRAGRVNL